MPLAGASSVVPWSLSLCYASVMNPLHSASLSAARHRRQRLATRLDGMPALIAAGAPCSRNFPSNVYPFRASSHFLYLVGHALPQAHLLLEAERARIFAPAPEVDDALWHGAMPSFAELSDALGAELVALEELPAALEKLDPASLLAPDLTTQARQRALLGRDVDPETSTLDATLADALIALRSIHDDAAIDELRAAAGATVAAHLAGMRATAPGTSEAAICAAMEAELAKRGMRTSYESIVTVHGEVLHNVSHAGVAEAGDIMLADVGAETATGWAGDVTRCWPVSGKFEGGQRDAYQVVLNAQAAALAAVKPGARYRDVHMAAARATTEGLVALGVLTGDVDELVEDGVHALLFPHGVGHLLGLDVHDMEDLGDRAGYAPGRSRSEQFGLSYLRLDRDLEPGMAVTIEPGLYVVLAILADDNLRDVEAGRLNRDALTALNVRGIRIEDDVLVTPAGHEVLTHGAPKEVTEVEAAVGG